MVEYKDLYVVDYGYRHYIFYQETFAELYKALDMVATIVDLGGFGRVTRETHLVINDYSAHKVEETIIVRFGE